MFPPTVSMNIPAWPSPVIRIALLLVHPGRPCSSALLDGTDSTRAPLCVRGDRAVD